MKHMSLRLVLVTLLALATSGPLTGADSTATSGSGPTFKHLGPLAFGPDGVLFAADSQSVSITALQLSKQMAGGPAGTKEVQFPLMLGLAFESKGNATARKSDQNARKVCGSSGWLA